MRAVLSKYHDEKRSDCLCNLPLCTENQFFDVQWRSAAGFATPRGTGFGGFTCGVANANGNCRAAA